MISEYTSDFMPSYKRSRTGSYKKPKYIKGKSYKSSKLTLYKTPKASYSLVYPIERNATVLLGYSRALGFQNFALTASSPYLGLLFSINQVSPYLGGTYDGTSAGVVPNSSELLAVFDQYRIKRIEVQLFYSHNVSATGDALMPLLRQALDFDSVNGTNALTEYQGCRTNQMGMYMTDGIKYNLFNPTVQGVVQDSTTTTGTANALVSPWIDSSANNTPHFGMRFQAEPFGDTTAGVAGRFSINVKYLLEFRRPR